MEVGAEVEEGRSAQQENEFILFILTVAETSSTVRKMPRKAAAATTTATARQTPISGTSTALQLLATKY